MMRAIQFAIFAAFVFAGISQVSADPIAMEQQASYNANSPRAQSARSGSSGRAASGRASGNIQATIDAVISGQPQVQNAPIMGSRTGNAGRSAVRTGQVNATRSARGTSSRGVSARSTNPRSATRTTAQPARSVSARTGGNAARSATTQTRMISARSGAGAAQQARATLSGNPIASSSSGARNSFNYSYSLNEIIDPNTGTLSQGSYQECLDNYYACMDEICAARSPGQRRCACSNRTNQFQQLEQQLIVAREQVLKLSNELQMLITTKGGDISAAFQLTDAELALNCVSYREAYMSNNATNNTIKWCQTHNFGRTGVNATDANDSVCANVDMNTTGTGNNTGATSAGPQYCTRFGAAGAAALDGGDSDILSQLKTFANEMTRIEELTGDANNNIFGNIVDNAFGNASFMETECPSGQLSMTDNEGKTTCVAVSETLDLWGEDLFDFAHNSICKRVLDSCFAGICGWNVTTPTDPTAPLVLPATQSSNDIDKDCWDKQITAGTLVAPGLRTTTTYSNSNNNYNISSDNFRDLRGPVTQARWSIKQKYHFDANADCDVFGEDLREQVQNMSYQFVAAQEMLKAKRLEFANERDETAKADLAKAKENYTACLSEYTDCQDSYSRVCKSGSGDNCVQYSRTEVHNRCSSPSSTPSCYETMVCSQSATSIVYQDQDCSRSETCMLYQNVVELGYILGGYSNINHSLEICISNTPAIEYIRCYNATTGSYGLTNCSID